MSRIALTTVDNPFDPFDDFDRWHHFDETKGYHSSGLVARVAHTSVELSDADNDRAIEEAVDFIIETHPNSVFRKVKETEKV